MVLGCFAVLWPKIFYPMLAGAGAGSSSGRQGEIDFEEEKIKLFRFLEFFRILLSF